MSFYHSGLAGVELDSPGCGIILVRRLADGGDSSRFWFVGLGLVHFPSSYLGGIVCFLLPYFGD